jgi:hypothetical protein
MGLRRNVPGGGKRVAGTGAQAAVDPQIAIMPPLTEGQNRFGDPSVFKSIMTPTERSWGRSILVPSADPAVKTGRGMGGGRGEGLQYRLTKIHRDHRGSHYNVSAALCRLRRAGQGVGRFPPFSGRLLTGQDKPPARETSRWMKLRSRTTGLHKPWFEIR